MGGITVDPLNWFRGFVVLANVAHELAFEVSEGGKDTASDDVSLDPVEPQFDLVEPGGVGRGVVDLHVGMGGQEIAHGLGLMSGKIVTDNVNLLSSGLIVRETAKKGPELHSTVP